MRDGVNGFEFARLQVGEVSLQVGDTPAATGSSTAAFAQLAGTFGSVDPQVVEDLPLGDVKAEADFVIELHSMVPAGLSKEAL